MKNYFAMQCYSKVIERLQSCLRHCSEHCSIKTMQPNAKLISKPQQFRSFPLETLRLFDSIIRNS